MKSLSGRVHIVGVGGAGMSGIARVLLARGVQVSGSDAKESRRFASLGPLGAQVYVGHDATRMTERGNPDVLVISTAITQSNPEVQKANELGIPVLNRASALAELMTDSVGVSVAGTHGKTTTTSMLTVILQQAGKDPSFVIGSEMNESGSNAHQGTGNLFVAEADESDGTFLVLPSKAAIVTNVEPDHLNYWGSVEALEQAFLDFVLKNSLETGFAVVCAEDPGARNLANLARDKGANVITYGLSNDCDAIVSILPSESAGTVFTVTYAGEVHGPIQLVVPGTHNALNATAAFVTAIELGCSAKHAIAGLGAFTGTHRRFEFRGEVSSVRVFDDYAHHPTEITAVLNAARTVVRGGRVLVAFQAHHFYRTALFSKEFGEALGLADFVVVLEVFAPGETPIPGASGSVMASNVPLPDEDVVFEPSWSAVPKILADNARSGDIILTLGAGDIGMMCPQILELLAQRSVL
ncbi:MAG: UDP-N-acetylmuramate--L-alanine ligase [Actinomycetales bacterium]|nr:UDP-N-acetylmuramate--L-alanine ligase [Actinomycetales bacterium]